MDDDRSGASRLGQIFLEHYVPRWEGLEDVPAGWLAKVTSEDLARNNG